MNTSFNISNVLSGMSKALTVANQAIPLYRQVSPMIKNARNVYSTVKDFSKNNGFSLKNIRNQSGNNNNMNYNNNIKREKKEVVYNNPIFFQ